MKKVLMILAITLICSCTFAKTPPKAVSDAFMKKFPTATKVSWGVEGPKEWEAEFTLEGKKISANFNENGTWVETEREINPANLPKAVLESLKLKYNDWKIAEADKTESSKHGTIYEVDLKKGLKSKSLAFKEDGTSIKE
jgi:hypothetical protein